MIGHDLADQLIYSTVRLVCSDGKISSTGTAFFMQEDFDGKSIIALVTNKHVVSVDKTKEKIFDNASFVLCIEENGLPIDNKTIEITCTDLKRRILFHPDSKVDLCFIFINDLINQRKANGIKPYFLTLNTNLIIDDNSAKLLSPIEDIIMIGYPNGLIDNANNKPIVRKGITATNFNLDYNFKKEFVIDAACFNGSSGSPVFLRRVGLGKEDKKGVGISIGISVQYALLGILYAGPSKEINGDIVIEDIPCSKVPLAKTKITINLGYVIKPCRILELFKLAHFTLQHEISNK